MKLRKNTILAAAAACICLATASCTDGYEDFNRNPHVVTKDETQRDAYACAQPCSTLRDGLFLPT